MIFTEHINSNFKKYEWNNKIDEAKIVQRYIGLFCLPTHKHWQVCYTNLFLLSSFISAQTWYMYLVWSWIIAILQILTQR